MSTIQQLKNFIRHGKQARANPEEPARTKHADHSSTHHHHQPAKMAAPVSEPNLEGSPPRNHQAPVQDAYSATQADGHNRVAQAGHAAAHHAEADQNLAAKAKSKTKIPDENIARLVAEENASKSKFPKYPGLERWELIEKMGDGAFSNVYRARDLEGNAGEVAIKVVRKFEMNNMQSNKHLHPDFKPKAPKAAERANILKEVQIMRQLDHPNIIKLVDFAESRQYYYIILELAPGGELFHQIVRLTYFSEDLSRHVITQVAKALEYLHEEKGVVHRDIKPENILFSPIPFVPSKHPKPKQPGDEDKVDEGEFIKGVGSGGIGQIKIADFGLSKIVWDKQTMTPCGTVGYTAPEIVKDERYSKAVDMWALGCVLYTLLCGFPPFYDESIEVLTEKVAKGQYTFLSPWWDDISKSAQDLISHLLCVDPEKRYTIREFLAHPWIAGSGPTPRDEQKNPTSAGVLRAFDASKIVDGDRRYDFRSPGAVNLREVFDVGYAVHRQEEEGKRRHNLGAKAGVSRLVGLDENSDEGEDVAMPDAVNGKQYHTSLEQSMRNAQIRDQQQEQRGRDRERKAHPPPAAAEQRGYGQHSAAVTAAARQQVRERNRQKGAFELNLDGATLLGRRGVKPSPAARVA
ncbi:kinase-like domain-containing protein [Pseudoneurospora amorphoporcata]|uniref:Kinase-like domain-containing protein n=1 Tax=Pseudoneurospora amorphoporcata TaxID=241081 RepID=A0AAN6NV65_9PEZI|nr:kinase-like domain-containing protein [Pseudoneurospora amorphoporcata]